DEHLLLPGRHPVLTTNAQPGGQLEIRYRERRYLVPADEVLVLPITNTSAENLATFVGGEIRSRMRARWPALRVRRLQAGSAETPGQPGISTSEDCLESAAGGLESGLFSAAGPLQVPAHPARGPFTGIAQRVAHAGGDHHLVAGSETEHAAAHLE